jgi:CheY-like chemotaxis protein
VTPGGRKRILGAEDEENIRAAITAVLQDRYEVDAVGRGDTAFDRLKSGRYDLVLSDVRMPGMDGTELFKAVKRIRGPVRSSSF